MSRTIKSSRVLIINTVLMLVFIVLLIAQNIYFLDRNNNTQAKIDNIYDRKLDVIMLMAKVVRERSLYMFTMYLSRDPWEKDEMFIKFHKLKLDFLDLNIELKSLGFKENEKTLFDKISTNINETELIESTIVERIQSGGDNQLHSDIAVNYLPTEHKVLGNLDSLIEVFRSNAEKARMEAKKQYRETLNLVAIAAVLVCFSVIVLMRRSLTQIHKIESVLIDEAETLSWDATHDALTNVYNRRWLQHKFELLDDEQSTDTTKHSMLYVDLDEFKPVNDNYGHVFGDNFLCGVTREFEQCIRQNDTLARMGGDEFAILLENCDARKAKSIAECLVKRVKKFSIMADDKKVVIAGCSVGIKEFITASEPFDELIKQADAACYEAKKNGKNQSHISSS